MINVLIWNEFEHERLDERVRKIYPEGIHKAIADFLQCEDDICVKTATFQESEYGLTQEVIDNTDVILWWGHMIHGGVPDYIAARIKDAVIAGMGAIFLHSAHNSKPFQLLMGTSCSLDWREGDDIERIWNTKPSHPITRGLGRYFELPNEEIYAEPFCIPEPDETVLMGWYEGGEVFRSGCCYNRGNGKVFYFQPGHEEYPTYYDKNVQQVIKNAVRWAYSGYRQKMVCHNIKKIGED